MALVEFAFIHFVEMYVMRVRFKVRILSDQLIRRPTIPPYLTLTIPTFSHLLAKS